MAVVWGGDGEVWRVGMCGVCRDRDGGWEVGCGLWVGGVITGRSSISREQRSL